MKILVSGNKDYGLAMGINHVMGGDYYSTSNGYDFSKEEDQYGFVKKSLHYDVVILNCHTKVANLSYQQAKMMHKIYVSWLEEKKTGHLFGIGSITDHINTEQPWIKYISYRAEKVALKNLCQTINHNRANVSPGIKCTYLSVGHMHTPFVDKLHPNEKKLHVVDVAKLIKQIAETDLCIEEMTVTADRNNE